MHRSFSFHFPITEYLSGPGESNTVSPPSEGGRLPSSSIPVSSSPGDHRMHASLFHPRPDVSASADCLARLLLRNWHPPSPPAVRKATRDMTSLIQGAAHTSGACDN
jgi:hypothetical protein